MTFKWKWHEAAALLVLTAVWVLLLILTTTLFAERMAKGTIIGAVMLLAVTLAVISFCLARKKGLFQSLRAGRITKGLLAAVAVFCALLFVPTQKTTGSPEFGSTTVQPRRPRYDARRQPGADLYVKMRDAVTKDALTLTIYDICVGKVSHRVLRDGKPSAKKIEITEPAVLTRYLKDQAKALGASTVGVAPLSPEFVFTHDHDGRPIALPHTSAIVVGMDLDYLLAAPTAPLPWEDLYSSIPEELAAALAGKMIKSTNSVDPKTVEQMRTAMKFFSEGGKTAVELARYIRSMGYSARAHYQRWSEVQIVPLAIRAGLGELARNGMVVSKELGPRGSFAVVTTDIPLVADHPVSAGIEVFCRTCKKCAVYCPVRAVPFGSPKMVRGVMKWTIDGEKCGDYLVSNPKCMACIGSCPYNKPDFWIHRAAAFMIERRSWLTNTLLLGLDNLLGYGEMAAMKENPAAAAVIEKADSRQGDQ